MEVEERVAGVGRGRDGKERGGGRGSWKGLSVFFFIVFIFIFKI